MAGSVEGGRKAAATNKSKYGEDFYRKIGKIGRAASPAVGAFSDKELASKAGRVGGIISKRVYTPEQRKEQSERLKQMWREGKFDGNRKKSEAAHPRD